MINWAKKYGKRAGLAVTLTLCWFLSYAKADSPSNSQTQEPGKKQVRAKPTDDVCSLLTKVEVEAVQGEPVVETKGNEQHGRLFASQCFYRLATSSKSVSLTLTTREPGGSSGYGPREFWKKTFNGKPTDEGGSGREEGDNALKKNEQEGEKEASKPLAVAGIGEEAYWTGNRITGALYVLKGNAFLRISIGGSEDESKRIEKTKTLAQKALERLDQSITRQ